MYITLFKNPLVERIDFVNFLIEKIFKCKEIFAVNIFFYLQYFKIFVS